MKMNGFSLYDAYWQTANLMGEPLPKRWEDMELKERHFWEEVASRYQPLLPSTDAQRFAPAYRKRRRQIDYLK